LLSRYRFFFQAEDGIRDFHVTGVQTCALPISLSQDGKILKVRSYSDIQILDPAFRLSAPEGDIMTAIFAGLATYQTGDAWAWKRSEERRVGKEGRSRRGECD